VVVVGVGDEHAVERGQVADTGRDGFALVVAGCLVENQGPVRKVRPCGPARIVTGFLPAGGFL
jgi:hypothetical protein